MQSTPCRVEKKSWNFFGAKKKTKKKYFGNLEENHLEMRIVMLLISNQSNSRTKKSIQTGLLKLLNFFFFLFLNTKFCLPFLLCKIHLHVSPPLQIDTFHLLRNIKHNICAHSKFENLCISCTNLLQCALATIHRSTTIHRTRCHRRLPTQCSRPACTRKNKKNDDVKKFNRILKKLTQCRPA